MLWTSTFPGNVLSVKHAPFMTPWLLPLRLLLVAVYSPIIFLRNLFYDLGVFKSHRVSTVVISVGNISVGGSGKTILVQSLVAYFLAHNKKPTILSRGYGRSTSGLFLVASQDELLGSPEDSGDEPFLMAKNFPGVPVLVAEDRVKGAQHLINKFDPDVIILDDGFQHRRLARDLDIVLIDFAEDAPQPLLPWGRLREHGRNISRADQVVYSKNGQRATPDQNLQITLDYQVFDQDNNACELNTLEGEYGLFAGLGNPESFFDSVAEIHGSPKTLISFDDHTKYGQKELKEIAGNHCDYWITTQKDFVKMDPLFCQQNSVYYILAKAALPMCLLDDLKHRFN